MRKFRHYVPLCVALLVAALSTASAEVRIFLPQLLKGAGLTVEIALASFALVIVGSFVAGLAQLSRIAIIRSIAIIYIEIFRGTSLFVQLFWIFFVLPEFGVTLTPMTAAILGLGLNFAAYGAEIVRGAILAVPTGQYDAAIAMNLSRGDTMRRIILPQALVAMVPPFGNLCVDLVKSTSLVSVIALYDLTFAAYQMNAALADTFSIFGMTMLLYYIFSQAVRIVATGLERRFARGLSRGHL